MTYGLPDDLRPSKCAYCKTDSMVDMVRQRCFCLKVKYPVFAFPGEKPTSCAECKIDGMMDVVNKRCEMLCCTAIHSTIPEFARGTHPKTKQGMCTGSMRCMVALEENEETKKELMRHFGFKKDLVLRAENTFYYALCLEVPELMSLTRTLDGSVTGKRKRVEDVRPDYHHVIVTKGVKFALHGEFDEDETHENCAHRLFQIAGDSSTEGNTYVFRVQGYKFNSQKTLCRARIYHKVHKYWILTPRGKEVVKEVGVYVRKCLDWMKKGLGPDEAADRPYVKYF
jgi:hypothetical protein